MTAGGGGYPRSLLEEGAGVCESYGKARSELRDIGLVITTVHLSRQLSFISTFENTSQVAPGKSAEVLIISRHLATHKPATSAAVGLAGFTRGAKRPPEHRVLF